MYKVKTVGDGRQMFFKDGHLVSKKVIPEDELDRLLHPEKPSSKVCIFCGKRGTQSRLVNLQMVDLCDKHYYDTSIGEIAQRLNNGRNT